MAAITTPNAPQTISALAAAAAIVVRLANVSFVDETGTDLLRKMFQAGAKLEGSGCMVRALIAQIARERLVGEHIRRLNAEAINPPQL